MSEGIEVTPMTEEDLEQVYFEESLLAHVCGFKTTDEYYDYKYHAAEGMIKFGGSFTHMLGHVLARADSKNSAKVIRTWRKDCDHHAELHRKFMSNRDKQMEGQDEHEKSE